MEVLAQINLEVLMDLEEMEAIMIIEIGMLEVEELVMEIHGVISMEAANSISSSSKR